MPEAIAEEQREVPWQDGALRLHYDAFIMPGVPALLEALQQAQRPSELHFYEQAGHAFLNDSRPEAYQEEAAADAWGQLQLFSGAIWARAPRREPTQARHQLALGSVLRIFH
jgi:dienelactone hydrolase